MNADEVKYQANRTLAKPWKSSFNCIVHKETRPKESERDRTRVWPNTCRRLHGLMKMLGMFGFSFMCVFGGGCASKTAPVAENTQTQQMVMDGKHMWELGQLDQAQLKLQRVLEIETNNPAASYYLALVHREQFEHRRPTIFTYHRTAVTNHQTIPLRQRTLKSYGDFNWGTTVEDVINRVGPPDMILSISGLYTYFYALPPPYTNGIVVETLDKSLIYRVTSGETVLFARGTNDW